MGQPVFRIRFWAAPKQADSWPMTWDTNHEVPQIHNAQFTADAVMKNNTFPTAVRYTIHDYKTDEQVYPNA